MKRTFYWTILLAFIGLVAPVIGTHFVVAQQNNSTSKTVQYDTPLTGQITDSTVEERWTLTAPATDRIAITMNRTDGTLVPKIELDDANKMPLASAANDIT